MMSWLFLEMFVLSRLCCRAAKACAKRGVRSALVNRLYCTNVCREWVSCLHPPSIFWNSFQETEITIPQMMLAAMFFDLFVIDVEGEDAGSL